MRSRKMKNERSRPCLEADLMLLKMLWGPKLSMKPEDDVNT